MRRANTVKLHETTLVRPKPDRWKWRCSCGRESRRRYAYPGLAEAAGWRHAEAMNRQLQAASISRQPRRPERTLT